MHITVSQCTGRHRDSERAVPQMAKVKVGGRKLKEDKSFCNMVVARTTCSLIPHNSSGDSVKSKHSKIDEVLLGAEEGRGCSDSLSGSCLSVPAVIMLWHIPGQGCSSCLLPALQAVSRRWAGPCRAVPIRVSDQQAGLLSAVFIGCMCSSKSGSTFFPTSTEF